MKDALRATVDGVEIKVNRRKAEQAPQRSFQFLRAVGLYPEIMERLANAGYTPEIHKKGWDLLHLASGYSPDRPVRISESHRDAVMALDAWDEPNYRRTKGALQHRFPSQYSYIFKDLSAERGAGALQGVQTYLRRVEALRDGSDPERTETKAQDKDAFALLETRKILTPDTLKQLHAWIKEAQEAPELPRETEAQKKSNQQASEAMVGLVVWFDEWSEVARAEVNKRNHLISLGLAKRRNNKSDEDTPSTTPSPNEGDLIEPLTD